MIYDNNQKKMKAEIEQDTYRRKVHLPKDFFELPDQMRESLKGGLDQIDEIKKVLFKPLTPQQFINDSVPQLENDSLILLEIIKEHQVNGLLPNGKKLQSCNEKAKNVLIANGYLSGVLKDTRDYTEQTAEDVARKNLEETFGPFSVLRLSGAVREVGYNAGNFVCWELIKKEEGYEENPYSYIMDLYRNGVVSFGFADSIEEKIDYFITRSLIKEGNDVFKVGEFIYEKPEGKKGKSFYSFKDLSVLNKHTDQGFPPPDLTSPIVHQRNQG